MNNEQGQWLEAVRASANENGLTAVIIAHRLGISKNEVSQILRGDWPFTGDHRWPLYFEQYVVEHLRIPPPELP